MNSAVVPSNSNKVATKNSRAAPGTPPTSIANAGSISSSGGRGVRGAPRARINGRARCWSCCVMPSPAGSGCRRPASAASPRARPPGRRRRRRFCRSIVIGVAGVDVHRRSAGCCRGTNSAPHRQRLPPGSLAASSAESRASPGRMNSDARPAREHALLQPRAQGSSRRRRAQQHASPPALCSTVPSIRLASPRKRPTNGIGRALVDLRRAARPARSGRGS